MGWRMKLCPCAQKRKGKNVCQSVSDALYWMCVWPPHPALCPLTPFSIARSACLLQSSSTLSDPVWTLTSCHPNLWLKHRSPCSVSICLWAVTSGFGDAHGCTSTGVRLSVCVFLFFSRLCGCPLSETQAESSWEICTQATGVLKEA